MKTYNVILPTIYNLKLCTCGKDKLNIVKGYWKTKQCSNKFAQRTVIDSSVLPRRKGDEVDIFDLYTILWVHLNTL